MLNLDEPRRVLLAELPRTLRAFTEAFTQEVNDNPELASRLVDRWLTHISDASRGTTFPKEEQARNLLLWAVFELALEDLSATTDPED